MLAFCLAIAILVMTCALIYAWTKRRNRKQEDSGRIRTTGPVCSVPARARPQSADHKAPQSGGTLPTKEEPPLNVLEPACIRPGVALAELERPGAEHRIQPTAETANPPDAGENRPATETQPPPAPTEPPRSSRQGEAAPGYAEQFSETQATGPVVTEGHEAGSRQGARVPGEVPPGDMNQGSSSATSPARPPTATKSPTEATRRSSEGSKTGANSHAECVPEEKRLGTGISPPSTRPRTPQLPSPKTDTGLTRKAPGQRINPPWVEFALHGDQKVQLVIPQQEFKEEVGGEALEAIIYSLTINGFQNHIQNPVEMAGELCRVQEQWIPLPEPVSNLQVEYPPNLKSRRYVYSHSDKRLYAFVPTRVNTGRLLSASQNLPKRLLWIALHEELTPAPGLVREISEQWVWEHYRPYLVDLASADTFEVQNSRNKETVHFDCRPSFQIYGDGFVEDDFQDYSPLFSERSFKVVCPHSSAGVFEVWLRDQGGRAHMIADAWDGQEELPLQPLDDPSHQCGEFQVDIRESGEITPLSTLFFRCVPGLTLGWSKELALPDSKRGHDPVSVQVQLADPEHWQVRPMGPAFTAKALADGYELSGSPGEDTCRFSISSKREGGSEVRLSVTPPRLRWSLGNDSTWLDKATCIKRGDIVGGSPLELRARINGLRREYQLSAALFEGECCLQGPVSMARRQGASITELNHFYDTVRHHVNASLEVRIGVCDAANSQTKGEVVALRIHPEPHSLSEASPQSKLLLSATASLPAARADETTPRRTTPRQDFCSAVRLASLCKLLRKLKVLAPRQRGACKRALQYYYDRIKGRGAEAQREVKVKFIGMTLAILKVAIGANSPLEIRRLEKWRTRVRRFEEEHPNEFRAASRLLAKRQ